MRRLKIYLQICGKGLPCGEIRGMSFEDACFIYDASYLERKEAAAISISLPLQKDPFDHERTAAFFSGLLPSGSFRRVIAGLLRCREEDYMSMLSILGSDCRGGIKALEEEFPLPESCLEDLDRRDLEMLYGGREKETASLLIRSSSALPGHAPVLCLRRLKEEGWKLPCGEMTGNFLVYPTWSLQESGLLNAALCMSAAEKLGIRTQKAHLTGKGGDDRIFLAVERSDREEGREGRIVRRHQEDMAQAMGILPGRAAERDYEGYMASMFRILRERACRPLPDMLSLWDRIIFNFLIGNSEGDIRSFALTYGPDLSAVSLAPASYISCSAMYDPLSWKLPFHIDGLYSPESLTGRSFENMAPECGLGKKMGRKRFDFLAGGLEKALFESAAELKSRGFGDAPFFAGQILETGGIRNLR